MLITPEWENMIQDVERRRVERIKELQSRSKPLHELVVTEKFTVDDVVAKSYATSISPLSEMRLGGQSQIYNGGFISRLVLQVTPDIKDIPVRTITFEGISVVLAGDYISAQIPRFEKQTESGEEFRGQGPRISHKFGGSGSSSMYELVFHLDRPYNPEESAIELAILSVDEKVLRRDRAVNYCDFVKK